MKRYFSTVVGTTLVLAAGLAWWGSKDPLEGSASPALRPIPQKFDPSSTLNSPPESTAHNLSAAPRVMAEPLEAFTEWTRRYLEADQTKRPALVGEGKVLAEVRRPVFKALIKARPQQALREAVPMVVRQELPESITNLLEERVNDRAALRVYQGVGPDNASPAETHRIAELESGRNYMAHVYGRRAQSVEWLPNAAVNGVALDADLAVNEDPFRPLEVGERPDPDKPAVAFCPVSGKESVAEAEVGQPVTEETPAVEAYGEIVYLCDGSHTVLYGQTLIQGEGATGGPITFTGLLPSAPTPSIGNVKVLVIPMTFADQNDTPSTESTLYNLMRTVGDHYAKASYGKLTLLSTVTPPVTLPHNEAWYVQKDSSNGGSLDGLGQEHAHARAEARKLGFDDEDYDCIVVRLRGGARPAGGWGGGRSVWIYGDGADVTAHEVGHVFGLAHANYWDTAGTSAIGTGTNGEYGGYYDVMGGFGLPNGHYNAQAKNQIRWLPGDFVTEATTSGLYRICAQDQAILDPGKRFALKIRKDNLRTYWGELRGVHTGSANETWTDNGLILGWKYPGGGGNNIQLIDTTPGSSFGKTDAPVSLGRTFSDTESGIHLTTLSVNPATDTEPKSVDVQVHLGDFPLNTWPTLSLAVSAAVVPVNAPVTFTAIASDADGDGLAYSWQHFGDGNYRAISPNSPQITRTFTASGTYVVTCTVSDMKGGLAIRNQLITVGNGGGKFAISGRVTENGEGLSGVIVNANSANGVITDSDGRYIIPNLSAGTYIMTPLRYGYTFSELFNNSAIIGPNFNGADFEASGTSLLTVTASVPTATEGIATPAKFLISRTGDASQALVVNVTSLSGSAASADYTLSPTLTSGSQGLSTLTIPAGQDSLEVTVTPVNDTASEGPETLVLNVAAGNGYLIGGNAESTITLEDNDTTLPRVRLVLSEAKTTEGSASPASFRVQRSGALAVPLTVNYNVSGTAQGGVDFTALTGSLILPVGASEAILPVVSLNDSASETAETIIVNLSANAAYVLAGGEVSATATVVDDDLQILTVSAADPVATERNLSVPGTAADTATFLIRRAGDTTSPLTVYYAVAGSTSGSTATALHGVDYEALPGMLVIPAGQSSGAVSIIPRWDGLGESPESVRLQLGAGPTNYQLGPDNFATATINDAGDPPYVEVICVDNATEGSSPTPGKFRFSLKGSSASAVTVNYTLSGTATSGVDYTPLLGSVSIPGSGLNTVEVTITPINDAVLEDRETVVLSITPGPAYGLYAGSASALMQLRDDEGPTLLVDANDGDYPPAFAENSSGGTFYISRTGSTTGALTVNYTLSGTALAGTDFAAVTGTAVIAAGSQGVDVQIAPINDSLAEGTETVSLSLAPGSYSRTSGASYYLTDDESPAVSVAFPTQGAAALENAGTVNIPVRLSAPATGPVTVEYQVDRSTHDTASATGAPPVVLPYWVRSVRSGNTFTGSISADGVTWNVVSSQTIAMSSASYQVGLALCSYNAGTAGTATFDNVSITGLAAGGAQGVRTSGNIGTPAITGSASESGGVYTVTGAGDNMEGTTDQGFATWWPVSNSVDCTITARVLTQSNSNALATAGVIIRETNTNNTRRSFMAATPGSGFEHHLRTTAAGSSSKTTVTVPSSLWVRVQREGNLVRALQSSDGSAWAQVGSTQTLAMGSELEAGLGVSSFSEGTLAAGQFDNVTLTPGPVGQLLGRTVGFSALQGTDRFESGVYSVTGSGDGFTGTADDGYFVSQPVAGDFTLSARVLSTSGPSSLRAGVMLRQTFDRRSRMAFVGGVAGGTPQFIWRHTSTNTAFGTGIDFTRGSGVLTFSAGTTEMNIPVTLTDDTMPEPDETIIVVLRNPNAARLGTNVQFAQVISDNDAAPLLPFVGFGAAGSSVMEGDANALIPVVLSLAPVNPVTIGFSMTAGTAQAPGDFVSSAGSVTFTPGQTVAFITVPLVEDAVIESTETLTISLQNPAGGNTGSLTSHTLTITDDDSPVITLASGDASATEGGDAASVIFNRSGPATAPLMVNYSRAGTATAASDYTGLSGTVSFPAGSSSVTLPVAAVQDVLAEGSETVILTLTSGSYTIGTTAPLTLTIVDDDRNVVTLSATGATAVEGGTAGQLTLTRTGSTAASLSVALTATGTATTATDYTTNPATITTVAFSAGQSVRTIAVTAVNDSVIEGDEVLLVQLGSGTYDAGGIGYASVRLVDNDVPPTLFISSPSAQGVVVAPGNGLILKTTVEDDGLPQPSVVTWQQITGPGTAAFVPPSSSTGTTEATFTLPGNYLLRATVFDGQYSASDQIAVTVGAPNSVTLPQWVSADIGPPNVRGYSGPAIQADTVLLAGAGIGYATNSDRAHAMTRNISGNGTIVTRLDSLAGNGQANAEAGISIRDTLHRYARRSLLSYTGSARTLRFRNRLTSNTVDTSVSVTNLDLPLWLKLQRDEATDTVTASYALDAAGAPGTWVTVGSPVAVTMDAGAVYSLTCTSGNDSVLSTATFRKTELTPAVTGPGEIVEDFNDGTQTGTYSYNAATDTHVMNGQPGGLDSRSMFRGQSVTGDFVLTVLHVDATSGAANAYSGIMIRDSMDDGAMAFVGRNPFSAYSSFIWRTNAKGSTSGLNGISQRKRWLRFVRRGNQVTALHAADVSGNPGAWAQLGQPRSVFMPPTVIAGLSVCNGDGVGLNTAQFSKLSLVPLHPAPVVNAGTLPAEITSPLALSGTVTDDGLPSPFNTLWSAPLAPGPVTFANPSALAGSLTFTAEGNYGLRLTADDGMSTVFDDLAFAHLSPYGQWQASQFAEGAAFAESGPADDPDKDGLNNLLEYALATSATQSNSSPGAPGTMMVSGKAHYMITLPKNPDATDTTVTVEASSNMTGPDWTTNGLVIVNESAASLTVRDSQPMDSQTRRFFRIRVTR